MFIYLLKLADKCGIDPIQASHQKLKLNQKKCPANLVRGKSENFNQNNKKNKRYMSKRPYRNLNNKDLIQRIKDERSNPCSLPELAFELTKRSKVSKKKKYALYKFITKRLHKIRHNEKPQTLTKEIAQRGIYIDFECFRDQEPTILGILINNAFEKVVFDEDLKTAAKASDARITTLNSAIADILDRATKECRRIIAYSEYDLNKIKKYTHLGKNVEYFYTNARKIADSWQKEHLKPQEIDNSLKVVAEKFGKPYPKYLLKKNPTTIIREVRRSLLEKEDFENLPGQVKKDWKNLLQYNWRDCWVMREFLIMVTSQTSEFS